MRISLQGVFMKRLALTVFLTSLLAVGLTGCDNKEEKDPLKDTRDGKTYKTVKIGEQVWMAENLNYKTENSFCYEDNESNCAKYGRLYTWDAAVNACPTGWHLPTEGEFEALFVAVGNTLVVGKKLKSTSGWIRNGNGKDVFGFSALPAGHRTGKGIYYEENEVTCFWGSTEGSFRAQRLCLEDGPVNTELCYDDKDNGFSVRCLKD